MGIPNYGYNWTFPYEKAEDKSRDDWQCRAYTYLRWNTVLRFSTDQEAQSPYFALQKSKGKRAGKSGLKMWRSIAAKIELAKEYELYGVGYWNLMRPFVQILDHVGIKDREIANEL